MLACQDNVEEFVPVETKELVPEKGNCFDPDSSCVFSDVIFVELSTPINLSTQWVKIDTRIYHEMFNDRVPRSSRVECKIISGSGSGIVFSEPYFATHFEGYLLRGRTYEIRSYHTFSENGQLFDSSSSDPYTITIPN